MGGYDAALGGTEGDAEGVGWVRKKSDRVPACLARALRVVYLVVRAMPEGLTTRLSLRPAISR